VYDDAAVDVDRVARKFFDVACCVLVSETSR
jgi:hypothetical protein